MAPNLALSKLELIRDMITSDESLTTSQMAEAVGCSTCAIKQIRSNLRLFGSISTPPINAGRPRSITPSMLEALCNHLLEKSSLYLDEMVVFLWDEFNVYTSKSAISRALSLHGWSKKTAQQKVSEHNADLQDFVCSIVENGLSQIVEAQTKWHEELSRNCWILTGVVLYFSWIEIDRSLLNSRRKSSS
uniref:Winged helix-turn helix domain-containing protein n=1 Tax=Coccidioides posadasii RMSCC 3488 TaxID=454284 RepID=A0A0J6F5N9_COCPO|nr:hypothetical protein CPAG_00621 [Coccidioides posadasii RMSCC 3488]